MKSKILLLLLVILGSLNSFSQKISSEMTQLNDLFLRQMEKSARVSEKEIDPRINGSPFLMNEFQPGEVITERGTFNPVDMRYNIEQDAMEFNMGGRNLYMDPTSLIKSITLNGEKYVVADYPFQSNKIRGFLVEIASGSVGLYAKKNLSFREALPPKALESEPIPAKYVRLSDTYYLYRPNEEMVKVNNIKDIMSLLPAQSAALKKYAKEDKLSNKNVDDMAKLLHFANTLL